MLAQFDQLIASANDRLLAEWERKCAAGEPVNVTEDMSTMTLEIILGAIFGPDLAAMHAETGENPFAVLTEDSARDLRFRLQLPQAARADRQVRRASPRGGQRSGRRWPPTTCR